MALIFMTYLRAWAFYFGQLCAIAAARGIGMTVWLAGCEFWYSGAGVNEENIK